MDCVNHPGVSATAYCQNCGKALCANCVRNAAAGQILCEPCITAWQAYQPFITPHSSGPNPVVAAVLGIFPGVGAMYNGQFLKGFIHVGVFVVLVSIAGHYGVFGILIAAWIVYQSFEAYHTARAMRDGQPLPDPLGINEVGSRMNFGGVRAPHPAQPGAAAPPANPGQPAQAAAGPYQTPYQQAPFTPPVPPLYWRRREPIGALVLIAIGVLFLLDQLNIFNGRLFDYTWPVLLIALGVWMIIRRLTGTYGGPK